MANKDLPSLESLQQKIDAAQEKPETEASANPADAGSAMRLGIELAAGVGVGVAIGYGMDHWLHTAPWLMILGFFFGCVAGFLNLKRAVAEMDKGPR